MFSRSFVYRGLVFVLVELKVFRAGGFRQSNYGVVCHVGLKGQGRFEEDLAR